MLRLLRMRPRIFQSGLRSLRGETRPGPQSIQLQRVKIRRKWFKPWVFLGTAAIYYACYQVYTTSVFAIVGKWLEDEIANMSAKERKLLEKEIEEDDSGIFIPLPGTTKMIEPEPYKGTDPEWREFAKLSRNQKRMAAIKYSLAETVRRSVEGHPTVARDFGTGWKLTRTWFDIAFPQRPPPTFERRGISYDDDGLSLATQPVDSSTVFKLQRTLMPTAVSLSMWTFSMALAKHNFSGMAKYFGYEPKQDKSNVDQTLEKIRQHMDKSQRKTSDSEPDPSSLDPKAPDTKDARSLPSTKKQTADGSTASSTSSATPAATDTSSESPSGKSFPGAISPFSKPSDGSTDQKIPSTKDIYGVKEVSQHTSGAWQALKAKFQRVWRPRRPFPPRGSVEFRGLVEVANAKASFVIDVQAFYDPEKNVIDKQTMFLAIRAIKPKQMVPLKS